MNEARYIEWATLSNRLSLLADDVSVEGVNLATDDIGLMTEAAERSRFKLSVVLILVAVFVGVFLLLIHRHLVRPLQMMNVALSALRSGQPLLPFASASMAEIRAVEGAIDQLQGVMQENEQARQQLERLATTDGLTGLFNRRHFMPLAEAEINRAHRYERPIYVGLADLDLFKQINDTHGHAAGDEVLRSVSQLFRTTLRQSDWVCRYGGEEFAFVFPETTLEEAQSLAERLRQCVAEHCVEVEGAIRLSITLSLGLADASACSLDQALKRADNALYKAKNAGRNCVVTA
jgi:diguanylate cyclase (GGDEF)-like protein